MIYNGREEENWWFGNGDGGTSTNYDNDDNYDYDELYNSF
jgi:hypothetical protein